ncbi:MAG: EAL domain-containing protein [Desulfovibrio sp.]
MGAAVLMLAFALGLAVQYQIMRANVVREIDKQLRSTTEMITGMVETAADVSIRNYLRAVAESNIETLTRLHERQQLGELTETQAKEQARSILVGQHIARTGYIYCVNSKGTVTVHPKRGVLGTNVSNAEFVQRQMRLKAGYLEYKWKNPEDRMPRDKVLYMAYFAPWDWIVSVTSYKSEFAQLISVEDFRERIEAIRLGKSGYAYVIAENGDIIIHPFLSGNFFNSKDATRRELSKGMSGLDHGEMTYLWKNPGDEEPREKMVFFNRIPQYGWIVGSSGYLDEFYEPANRARLLILLSLVAVLLLALPLVLLLNRSITQPLTRLIAALSAGDAEQGRMVRVQWDSKDELGMLTKHFNSFMDRIVNTREELNAEVQERKNAEGQLLLFKEIYENAIEGISLTTPDGLIVAVNPAFTKITGYAEEEVLGKPSSVLKSDRQDKMFYKHMWDSLKTEGAWSGEVWNRRKDGEVYPEWLSISSIRDTQGAVTHYMAVFHDISAVKMQEDQIRFLAYHDSLTGLPNRSLLMDRLEVAISHAKRHNSRMAILFIDLDNFKHVNDSLGHAQGDTMLVEFVRRVQKVVRDTDTLARLGGDEFVVMAEDISTESSLVLLAERIMSCLDTPFQLEGKEFYATASMGITVFPHDGKTPGELIKNADLAMYWAKDAGKNRYHLYTGEMNEQITRRLQLEADLRKAMEHDEIGVYFQPRVSLPEREVRGVEALARWILPTGEVIPPSEFIPLAEETGLIVPLGLMILEKALRAVKTIHDKGRPLHLSVNLSPKQFMQSDLMDRVEEVLKRTGYPARQLEFEITETVIMKHLETSLGNLHRLSRRGIRLAIDDFGTGYSSLYYLKRLPIDVLKIDRSFIQDITTDPNDAKLVETIILLAKNFGLTLVAEGVEEREQLEFLERLGCDEIQGYFFSKPLPFDEFLAYLGLPV